MKKFIAFTLAETLIVIGVIGIVSALTLPNLNSSTGDKERVAKVKKIYQNLQDAFGRAEAVYGPYEEWIKTTDTTDGLKSKRIGERITEFMKLSKNCETSTDAACNGPSITPDYYKVITADGTWISFNRSEIDVDIDGLQKGPSEYGVDLFRFVINENLGIVPNGTQLNLTFPNMLRDLEARRGYAAYWIIKYDNADYLQIKEVSGDKAKCKNDNIMTEDNPRCK